MQTPSAKYICTSVQRVLNEDIASGDLTAALVRPQAVSKARIVSREEAIICGSEWVETVFRLLDPEIQLQWRVKDGDRVNPDQILVTLNGPSRALLSGERVALNFMQTLSGTATVTGHYVDAVKGTRTRILDTRKTIPGLRLEQKYAVTCGGGHNHRVGLYDGILIKENHIAAAGGIREAVTAARKLAKPGILLEVEVETLAQLEEAIAAGAPRLLLDNFNNAELRKAVKLTDGRAELEASGNMDLGNIREVAETGVDYISIGALTKHVRAVDLSMRFIESERTSE